VRSKSCPSHPCPLLASARSFQGVCQLSQRYAVSSPRLTFRLYGAGYRVRSRLYSSSRSRKWERLWVARTKPPGTSPLPLEWWVGRGNPIHPYLLGQIGDMLRRELKPKEIRLAPSDLFGGEGAKQLYRLGEKEEEREENE